MDYLAKKRLILRLFPALLVSVWLQPVRSACVSTHDELLRNANLSKVVRSMGGISQLTGIWDHPWSAGAVIIENTSEGFRANIRDEGFKKIEICEVANNPLAAMIRFREPASTSAPVVLIQSVSSNRIAVSVNGGSEFTLTRRIEPEVDVAASGRAIQPPRYSGIK